ncbi:dsDNA nuclease domain-containing protein [Dictyobacter kobayashii]|uniref:NACHT domain-containing protein n=1 Tax=Dictyobacter kobayashii TaxID=2014872 RepID=A0A402AP04_9CHLR|nr:dsDNA nuclease domain-containing protein [Dictyobacter kobayashii]GCE20928.1 hypothetical protein KDK_47280 [Dictyobacter kobayashii]
MSKKNKEDQDNEVKDIIVLSENSEVSAIYDPGDDTQRRYRYQHAYGVILLLAAASGKKSYKSIWCEHYEDLLGERNDGLYDAYQIKTRHPSYGLWNLTDEALKHSIKRFVMLQILYPEKFHKFIFVSNMGYEDSNAKRKAGRSVSRMLQQVQDKSFPDNLDIAAKKYFEALMSYCSCDASVMVVVFRKLKLLVGPDLDGFEAVIAQEHLPMIPECSDCSAKELAEIKEWLIGRVYQASSLVSDDPSRHWFDINDKSSIDPMIKAKELSINDILNFFQTNVSGSRRKRNNHIPNEQILEALNLYLNKMFKEDQFAKLDQAGETDLDKSTLLREVFVDLDLKPRNDLQRNSHLQQGQLTLFDEIGPKLDIYRGNNKSLSAVECFFKEIYLKIVLIGGPGQGKSTLGQYIAQVHRGLLLKRENELPHLNVLEKAHEKEIKPKNVRVPFRIVLKYFAQWLSDKPDVDNVEAYIAEQVGKASARQGKINSSDIQEIMHSKKTLVIFDGLDEVTEVKLRQRVLDLIEDFLDRISLLHMDVQLMATSRPTGYSDQFNPAIFWHLELQPMATTTVQEYTSRWAEAKVPSEEERRRVKDTLEECLQEEHTRLLLTTPLQVTIVLLIIKDGGRPPSQREGLFQHYWTTILRREKSKARGVIRTDDTLLFNLHAYLGYLLHTKSASENVRSLLQKEEFESLVYKFLKSNDRVSSDDILRQRAEQMVEEAKNRLVLLVEPEPDLFGFELRSLQEFFAGAYLAQTAQDTIQRFARLKAIARSEHWRNVVLFFAGRIIRDFSGESANILELVCRPIDREMPDVYLRRGSWLSLDIAADGVFATNRNLQYSAIEYALNVLDTGITLTDRSHLDASIKRLSPEDRRDILSKLLGPKLLMLPTSLLPEVLRIHALFIDNKKELMQGLELLVSDNSKDSFFHAMDLAFGFKLDVIWIVKQLKENWELWLDKEQNFHIWKWFELGNSHSQKVIYALDLSVEQACQLLDIFYFIPYMQGERVKLPEKVENAAEQVFLFLQCIWSIGFLARFSYSSISPKSSIAHLNLEASRNKRYKKAGEYGLSEAVEKFLLRKDFLPRVRMALWCLYWLTHDPNDFNLREFFSEVTCSPEVFNNDFVERSLRWSWPLFLPVFAKNRIEERIVTDDILYYLTSTQQLLIDNKINNITKVILRNKQTKDKNILNIYLDISKEENLREISDVLDKLDISSAHLVELFVISTIDERQRLSLDSGYFILNSLGKNINDLDYVTSTTWQAVRLKWVIDSNLIEKGKQLVVMLLGKMESNDNYFEPAVNLLFKLLAYDQELSTMLPAVLNALGDCDLSKIYSIDVYVDGLSFKTINYILTLTSFQNEKLRRGVLFLFGIIINNNASRLRSGKNTIFSRLKNVRIDWNAVTPLLESSNRSENAIGYSGTVCQDKKRAQIR